MHTPAQLLRERFASPGVIRLMGAHDALGAKLIERAGFEGVWSSGFEISTSHGVPDASILAMPDFLRAAQSMVEAIGIPVVADCDTGFGNSNNVMRMVRQFEAAGVAAVCIEDKLFPKQNSLMAHGRQELAPIPEFVGKLLAAKAAQRTPDFMVIARVEALIAGWDVAEAIRRADAYVQAGADAILMHEKRADAAQLREFMAEWKGGVPVVVVPTAFPQITVDELAALGAKMIVYANQGLRASVCAMTSTFRKILADGASAGVEGDIASMEMLFELQGMPALKHDERAYLRTAAAPARAVILAAGDHRDSASMRELAAEVPIAALDVAGKTLLRRQVETLAQAGIRDVTVITGYRSDAMPPEGTRTCHNREWATTGEAVSLMCASDEELRDDVRTLVVYGDILFDADLVRRVLHTGEPVLVVADRSAGRETSREGKRLDHVQLNGASVAGRRFLSNGALRPLKGIGKQLAGAIDGEFAGIALFDRDAWRALRDDFASLDAVTAKRAAMTDLLQRRVDGGGPVSCLEVTSGWIEIHSFDDYQAACKLVTR